MGNYNNTDEVNIANKLTVMEPVMDLIKDVQAYRETFAVPKGQDEDPITLLLDRVLIRLFYDSKPEIPIKKLVRSKR